MEAIPCLPVPFERNYRSKPDALQSAPSTPTSTAELATRTPPSPQHSTSSSSSSSCERRGAQAGQEWIPYFLPIVAPKADASTPLTLWPATPTPGAKGASDYSFALPPLPEKSGMNVHAIEFVPAFHQMAAVPAPCPTETALGSLPSAMWAAPAALHAQSLSQYEAQSHAEAQAVTMVEAVLEPLPRSADVQVPSNWTSDTKPQAAQGWPMPPEVLQQGVQGATVTLPSLGSAFHQSGQCKPCAWLWKPRGCQNAASCDYCHLCPEGELKQRKKSKVAAIRMGALAPRQSPSGLGRGGNLKLFPLL